MSSASHERNAGERAAFEGMLSAVRPVESLLNRERTMYFAGLAEGKRRARRGVFWPMLSAMLTVVVGVESSLLGSNMFFHDERSSRVATPLPLSLPGSQADGGELALIDRDGAASRSGTGLRDRRGTGLTAQERLGWHLMRYGLDGLPPSPEVQRDRNLSSDDNLTRGALLQREVGALFGMGGTT